MRHRVARLGPAFTPVTTMSATEPRRGPCSESRTFWFQAFCFMSTAPSACLYHDASISGLPSLAIPSTRPPDHRCWQSQPVLTVRLHSYEKAALSRGLHTTGLLQPHASVGSRGRTPGQFLMDPPTKFLSFDSYIRDFESHLGVVGNLPEVALGVRKVTAVTSLRSSHRLLNNTRSGCSQAAQTDRQPQTRRGR